MIPRFLTLLQNNKKWSLVTIRCQYLFCERGSKHQTKNEIWSLSCCSTIQGTLPISRHFLFVGDAIKAFLLLLEKGTVGEIYNVGTSFEISITQLAQELVRMVGLEATFSENHHQLVSVTCS